MVGRKLWLGLVLLFCLGAASMTTFVGCQKKQPKEGDQVAQKNQGTPGDKNKQTPPKDDKDNDPTTQPKDKEPSDPPKKEPVKKSPEDTPEKKKIAPKAIKETPPAENPEKQIVQLFDQAKTALKNKDYSKLASLMTKQSQQVIAGSLLAESVVLKKRAENKKIAKAFPELAKAYQPIAKTLASHDVGDAFFGKAGEFKDLFVEWRSNGISPKQAKMAKDKFIDLANMANIKDSAKFIGDYLKHAPKQPLDANAKLTNLKVDGDQATATLESDSAQMPIAFEKQGDQWHLQVTPDLLNAVFKERQQPKS